MPILRFIEYRNGSTPVDLTMGIRGGWETYARKTKRKGRK